MSARGRELTEKVFGEPLPPPQVVERICDDVAAPRPARPSCTTPSSSTASASTADDAARQRRRSWPPPTPRADPAFLETVRRVRQNVLSFQLGLLHRDAVLTVAGRHELRLRYRPLRRVGVCIPGGAAAYPSTLLMTVCPAQAAGVKEIAVVMPPTPNGGLQPRPAGRLPRAGRHARSTASAGPRRWRRWPTASRACRPVDMIVGPGNLFVALAKRHVFGQVAIDCIAGPSEVVVLADDSAHAGLRRRRPDRPGRALARRAASWSPGTSRCSTRSPTPCDRQLAELSRGDLARDSLEQFGALVLARDEDEAVDLVEPARPRSTCTSRPRDPEALAEQIDNAGAIFLGHYTPVALGDYAAGPSHVLPTGGTARFTSGLSANDFLQPLQRAVASRRDGLARDGRRRASLAEKEGLTGHAASVDVRLTATSRPPACAAAVREDVTSSTAVSTLS